MYSVFLGAFRFAPDQDGKSRVLCLVSSSAFKGHAPRQTCMTPIRSLVHLCFTCRFRCFSPYKRAVGAFLERCRTHALRDGIDYALMTTEMAPEMALRDYLLRRGRRDTSRHTRSTRRA